MTGDMLVSCRAHGSPREFKVAPRIKYYSSLTEVYSVEDFLFYRRYRDDLTDKTMAKPELSQTETYNEKNIFGGKIK